jgi:hypothetical protein
MYAIARVTADGMIRLYPNPEFKIDGYGCSADVFHRGDTLRVTVPDYDTLAEAKAQLSGDPEEFIMEFARDKTCEALWFSKEQQQNGIADRLRQWHVCYGHYPVRTLAA